MSAEGRLVSEPSDPSFADFVAQSDLQELSVQLVDSPQEMRAVSVPLKLWVIALWMIFIFAVAMIVLSLRMRHGASELERGIFVAFLCLGPMVIGALVCICWFLNRDVILKQSAWFSIDKANRILALPRDGLQLRAEDVSRIVAVRGWYEHGPRHYYWLWEISVVTPQPQRNRTRFRVVLDAKSNALCVVQSLSGMFQVPVEIVRWSFLRRRIESVEIFD